MASANPSPSIKKYSLSFDLEPTIYSWVPSNDFTAVPVQISASNLARSRPKVTDSLSSPPEKGVDLDCHSVEFDDVRYHIQVSMKKPQVMVLSVSLPTPPPEAVFYNGLPVGAIEAIKAAYGPIVQILDPPKDGYNLTMKLYLSKLPPNEGSASFLSKVIMSFCYE